MQQLTGGKVLASGMEKSVRFVGNEWETAIAMVQIDCAFLFYSESFNCF